MVQVRVQPLYSMASSIAHDSFLQEANTISYVHLLNVKGVTSLGRHTRPACHQAPLAICWLKKVDFDLHIVCFSWTSGDARGLGLLFLVCASAVGLRGNRLIAMRGTWGVVCRSAHVPTIPFTWLRRAKAWAQLRMRPTTTPLGVFLRMPMFFTPCSLSACWLVERGHVNKLMTYRMLMSHVTLSNNRSIVFAALWLVTDWSSHVYYWNKRPFCSMKMKPLIRE